MKDFELHEQLEMNVLDEMRKIKILDQIIFGGGTMLRLCFDLPRFSVDFDFYLTKETTSFKRWASKLTEMFQTMGAQITDQWEKRLTYLWEIKLTGFPRRLKIEIRKTVKESKFTEVNIAHSFFSSRQVRIRTLTLNQMFLNKIEALCDRDAIRDAYDLEFIAMRGVGDFEKIPNKKLSTILSKIQGYSTQDFKVKLGSFLPTEERDRVSSSKFAYLKAKITPLIALK